MKLYTSYTVCFFIQSVCHSICFHVLSMAPAKTRAKDLLADFDGSIWVAGHLMCRSLCGLGGKKRSSTKCGQHILIHFVGSCHTFVVLTEVVDDDKEARRKIKEILKSYSKATSCVPAPNRLGKKHEETWKNDHAWCSMHHRYIYIYHNIWTIYI